MFNVPVWMVICLSQGQTWLLLDSCFRYFCHFLVHIAGSSTCAFTKGKWSLIYNISDEKERIYEEFDHELRALSEPSADVFSHGFIFHQSAIHVGLTEDVLHLKGYKIKENIVFFLLLELLNIDIIHPPPFPPFLSLLLPHRLILRSFCFDLKSQSETSLLLRNHLHLGYSLSMMHFT